MRPRAALRRNKILDIKTLEEDPGAAMEFARSKSTARKEGLTGVEFKDVAGLGPLLQEVGVWGLRVWMCSWWGAVPCVVYGVVYRIWQCAPGLDAHCVS